MTEVSPRHRRFIAAALLAALLWGLLAGLAVPPLIRAAHAGESHPVFNALINHYDPENTVEYYLSKWRFITWGGVLLCLGAAIAGPVLTSRWFYERFVPPATAIDLGAIRIIVCGILLINALWEDLPSTAALPWDLAQPMGIISVLQELPIGFAWASKNYWFLLSLQSGTAVLLLAAMLGLRTRVTLPLATVAYVLMAGLVRQNVHLFHSCLVPLWLLALLCFTPCGDAWSLDRWRKSRRNEPLADPAAPAPVYAWSRWLVWVLIALPYMASGIYKLSVGGLYWWDPLNIKVNILSAQMNDRADALFSWQPGLMVKDAPPLFFAALGLAALLTELFFPLVLLLRPARFVFPASAGLMHLGILLLQKVKFFDLMLLPLVFVNYTWMVGSRQWATGSGRQAVGSEGSRRAVEAERGPGVVLPAVAALMVTAQLLAAAGGIEKYPLTAWSLFSGRNTVPVASGWKLKETTRAGVTRKAEPGRYIGLVRRHGHADFVLYALSDSRRNDFRTFLEHYAAAHNRTAPAEDQIVEFDLQFWRWDFAAHPEGPEHAILVRSIKHEVGVPYDGQPEVWQLNQEKQTK